MPQTTLVTMAAFVGALAVLQPRTEVTRLSSCYGSDAYANSQVAYLRALTTSPKTLEISYRTRLQLPAVEDTAEIYVVSDSVTCASALTAHNSAIGYSSTELQMAAAQQVYLIRVKDVFVASNPHVRTGGSWIPQVVMNGQFQTLTTFMH